MKILKFLFVFYLTIDLLQCQLIYKKRKSRSIQPRDTSCHGQQCSAPLRDFWSVLCMGELNRAICVPVCQESCLNGEIIKDENCHSNSCRLGCICPPERPLRKGLKCIRREDCGPSSSTVRTTASEVCPDGMMFTNCVPTCQRTCDNINEIFTQEKCPSISCVSGCICSGKKNILHQGKCISTCDDTNPRIFTEPAASEIKCGKQFYKPNVRIVGGERSLQGSWPWTTQLFKYTYDGTLSLKCSGVIICERWILTAAHCFEHSNGFQMDINKRNYQVEIGKHFKSIERKELFARNMPIEGIVTHPEYNFHTKVNDIALIKLAVDMKMSNHIRPACLPPYHFPNTPHTIWGPQLGSLCYVVGWGDTKGVGASNNELKQTRLSVRMTTTCNNLFADYKPHTMLCIGGRKRNDACSGDSGGGLLCKHDDRWYVDGIISYGITCGVVGEPGVYTRVTAYTKWIQNYTGVKCGNISHVW